MDPFSPFEPYGGLAPPERLTGHLLVASPRLADPNFTRRVILGLDHGEHGALGVVIDRPGGVAVGELLPQWHPLATAPAELFTGGPVARNALIGLVRLASRHDSFDEGALERSGWRMLVDADRPVGTVDLSSDPMEVVGRLSIAGRRGNETERVPDGRIAIGSGVELDHRAHAIRRHGKLLPLHPQELALLDFLVSNPGRAFSRAEFVRSVWHDVATHPRVVDVYVFPEGRPEASER